MATALGTIFGLLLMLSGISTPVLTTPTPVAAKYHCVTIYYWVTRYTTAGTTSERRETRRCYAIVPDKERD